MARSVATTTIIALTLLTGACGRAINMPNLAEPTPPPSEASPPNTEGWQRCTNTQDGYSLTYPASWHTNPGGILPTCIAFDDDRIELEAGTEVPLDLAVFIDIPDRSIGDLLLDEEPSIRVTDRQTTRIAGRRAVEIRGRSTGDALVPEGTVGHHILVRFDDDSTLLASTYDLHDRPLEDNVAVMRQMIGSLNITTATPSSDPTS